MPYFNAFVLLFSFALHKAFIFIFKHFFLFLLRFDPDFICNASDNSGRYSYQAQPAICQWNLARLAEALDPDLPPERAKQVLDEYLPLYNTFYLNNMRKKLGLLKKEPEDETLITELMQTMHNTGMKIILENLRFNNLIACRMLYDLSLF